MTWKLIKQLTNRKLRKKIGITWLLKVRQINTHQYSPKLWSKKILHMFHTYVASVFIWILHMFCNVFFQVFLGVFASVSDACFKCFICLQTHVVNIFSYRYFKSRSSVAHVAMWLICHHHLLQLLGRHACVREAKGWSGARRCGKRRGKSREQRVRPLPGVDVQQPQASGRGLQSRG
jgi:hypothetical protein